MSNEVNFVKPLLKKKIYIYKKIHYADLMVLFYGMPTLISLCIIYHQSLIGTINKVRPWLLNCYDTLVFSFLCYIPKV